MEDQKESVNYEETENESKPQETGETLEQQKLKENIESVISEEFKENLKENKTNDSSEKMDEKLDEFDLSALLPDNMEQVLKFMVYQLHEWAHVFMGLSMNPKKKQITKDFKEAKIAVDSTSALVEILLPLLSQKEQGDFKIMMSDLKLNYISKAREENKA